jgi:hypothetical protein
MKTIINHLFFIFLACLAVIFADVRTINDAPLYLKINSLFFENGFKGLFAAETPVISSVMFSVIAILPVYIVFFILQHVIKKQYIVVAFLATITSSAVLFSNPYTFFQSTRISENTHSLVIFLYVLTTYILEIVLWGALIYTLIKKRRTKKTIITAILFPVIIATVFFITGITCTVRYADFITVIWLFFFNLVAIPAVIPEFADTANPSDKSTISRNIFIFYVLLIAGLFTFSQHLNSQTRKIKFFESISFTFKDNSKFSYHDARQADIPPVVLQRYGNKQINSEFLAYSLFRHHKSIVVFFPHGEIFKTFADILKNMTIEKDMFSYIKTENITWFTDSVLFTCRNIKDSLPFDRYIPVNPFDSVYISVERTGSNNGFINIAGYDNRRVPQFVAWVNSTDYFKEYLKHDTVEWEYLYLNCLIPEKTNELRINIKNNIPYNSVDTIYFRNLEVKIKRNNIWF